MPKEIKYLGQNKLWIFPSFASHPEGISTENIFSSNLINEGKKNLYGSLSSPLKGKPKIASIMKLLFFKWF